MASKVPMVEEQFAFRKHASRYGVLTMTCGRSPLRARNVMAAGGRLEAALAQPQPPLPHGLKGRGRKRRQVNKPAVTPTIPNAVICCQSMTR
jgi:hypothetical protein